MATDQQGSRRVATQENYGDRGEPETAWVDLEHGDGSFQVQVRKQMAILRGLGRYGVDALFDDEADGEALLRDGDFTGFMDNEVVPFIRQPAVYWSDPRDLGRRLDDIEQDNLPDMDGWSDERVKRYFADRLDAPIFDLGDLHEEDLMSVIAAMTGRSQAEIQQDVDGDGGRFR